MAGDPPLDLFWAPETGFQWMAGKGLVRLGGVRYDHIEIEFIDKDSMQVFSISFPFLFYYLNGLSYFAAETVNEYDSMVNDVESESLDVLTGLHISSVPTWVAWLSVCGQSVLPLKAVFTFAL